MQAAQALIARGNKTALVRRSDGDCAVAAQNVALSIQPIAVQVVDKTGGGDAFAGALAVALIEKRETLDVRGSQLPRRTSRLRATGRNHLFRNAVNSGKCSPA